MNLQTMFTHTRARSRSGTPDPIPPALRDSLWLGGEALVAPAALALAEGRDGTRAGEDADPSWISL